jgi:hypothetical protein
MLVDCLTATEPNRSGQELLKRLFRIARNPDPVEEVFPRLLRAARLSGDIRQQRRRKAPRPGLC